MTRGKPSGMEEGIGERSEADARHTTHPITFHDTPHRPDHADNQLKQYPNLYSLSITLFVCNTIKNQHKYPTGQTLFRAGGHQGI